MTIGKSDLLSSKILNENRTLNIYLPENYNANDTINYPVIYILDGGMEEDFLHIAGIVRFNTQDWIGRFPRSIVVGIEGNTRKRDFTFTVSNIDFIEKEGFSKSSFPQCGGSGKYMDFIEKELQPYINKTYKTDAKKTIIGESLAGLITTEILLKRPHLFDDYIIISPSLWWGEQLLLTDAETLLNKNLSKKVNVYLGVPNKEEDIKMYNESEMLQKLLKSQKNINLIFDYMPEELHSTIIHQAVYNAFKKLYPKTAYSK
nr:alpha/beta hydrolase-fold protein [Paenimyroides ummariense]